jgi:hypothetical protein
MDRNRRGSMAAGALGPEQLTRSSATFHWPGPPASRCTTEPSDAVGWRSCAVTTPSEANAATLPAGFQESVAFSGLTNHRWSGSADGSFSTWSDGRRPDTQHRRPGRGNDLHSTSHQKLSRGGDSSESE